MDERETGATRPGGPVVEERPAKRGGGKWGWWLLALVLAFGAGFGWQYYRAMEIEDQLERTEQELAVERLRVGLAQAAVAAQSGDYEAARRQMSDFFTAMQGRLEQLPPDVRATGEEMLRQRDDVITELSRANPESGETLYQMLVRFRISTGDPPVPVIPAGDTGEVSPEGG